MRHPQLQALHAQAVSMTLQIEALLEQEAGAANTGCPHPPEKRRNVTTLANEKPMFRCDQCGQDGV